MPLDATYVCCRIISILYKIDICDGLMEQYHGQTNCSLRVCHN
jgi:hypothetical protein